MCVSLNGCKEVTFVERCGCSAFTDHFFLPFFFFVSLILEIADWKQNVYL